jgi:hypothetical protein
VRRDSLVAVFMMAALTACRDAAPGGGQAPAPANAAPSAAGRGDSYPGPSVASNTVSGCVEGASLVKAVITLTPVDKKCHADVTPASVCVVPGGVILWRIENDCDRLAGDDQAPALEITVPTFKAHLGGVNEDLKAEAATGLFPKPKLESCGLKAPTIEKRSKPGSVLLFCEVDRKAPYGFYKYGLKGQIDPLDPDVEVRGGR